MKSLDLGMLADGNSFKNQEYSKSAEIGVAHPHRSAVRVSLRHGYYAHQQSRREKIRKSGNHQYDPASPYIKQDPASQSQVIQ
jgi:hypothetical protein